MFIFRILPKNRVFDCRRRYSVGATAVPVTAGFCAARGSVPFCRFAFSRCFCFSPWLFLVRYLIVIAQGLFCDGNRVVQCSSVYVASVTCRLGCVEKVCVFAANATMTTFFGARMNLMNNATQFEPCAINQVAGQAACEVDTCTGLSDGPHCDSAYRSAVFAIAFAFFPLFCCCLDRGLRC